MFLDGDTLIFIDFRADRMRQIVEAFGIKPQFETDKIPKDIVSGNSKCIHQKETILCLSLPPQTFPFTNHIKSPHTLPYN